MALGRLNLKCIVVYKVVQETCSKYNLVADYEQRPQMNYILTHAVTEVDRAIRSSEIRQFLYPTVLLLTGQGQSALAGCDL